MNEIRKNTENEEILIEGTFKLSPGALLTWLIGTIIIGGLIAFLIIIADSMTGEVNGEPASGWMIAFPLVSVLGFIFLVFEAFQILKLIGIKKSQLVVTNKRIYGTHTIFIAKKDFSYRLDEVDNVEMFSSLGQHTLAIQFSQGYGMGMPITYINGVPTSNGYNLLRMSNLRNYKEVFDIVNALITERKNLVDVHTDIEKGKLDAENRKADALENVAKTFVAGGVEVKKNSSKANYIDELKELKELLDNGIITQEEFNQEKKEILNNNHKWRAHTT